MPQYIAIANGLEGQPHQTRPATILEALNVMNSGRTDLVEFRQLADQPRRSSDEYDESREQD